MGKGGTPKANASPCLLSLTLKSPPRTAPIPDMNSNAVPKYPHNPLTICTSAKASNIELAPHMKKNAISSHSYVPNAYSLTIRQLGLNSGLVKCSANKLSKDVMPAMIDKRARIFMAYRMDGL